jgi:hypothetical protein
VTLLALSVDYGLSLVQTRLTPRALRTPRETTKTELARPVDAIPGVGT